MTNDERNQIAEILSRRANEVAMFKADYTKGPAHFGSVEMALSREINRLRDLADLLSSEMEDEE